MRSIYLFSWRPFMQQFVGVAIRKAKSTLPCNCRKKAECPLNRTSNVIYKCVVSAINHPNKVYIGLSEGEWKRGTTITPSLFALRNTKKAQRCQVTCENWKIKTRHIRYNGLSLNQSQHIITKRCLLCLHEKLAIVTYSNADELLNKRSELISWKQIYATQLRY